MANTESRQTHDHHSHAHNAHAPAGCSDEHAARTADTPSVTDPVCGMKVDPATSKHRFDHAGHTFHFCSARCRGKFVAAPTSYLTPPTKAASPVPKGTIYTCPMHPQIRQDGPGNCPICGMALEPIQVTAEAGPNTELIDMTRRFWIGLVQALP